MSEVAGLLIFSAIVFVFVLGMWAFSFLFGPKKPSRVKSTPFECGMEPIGPNRVRFSVQYYIYAIMLIVFDIEAIFLIPLTLVYKENKLITYSAIAIFLLTALFGYLYVYKRGGFEFEE
jgi:NADH-quinone oxidoreductase subunit A